MVKYLSLETGNKEKFSRYPLPYPSIREVTPLYSFLLQLTAIRFPLPSLCQNHTRVTHEFPLPNPMVQPWVSSLGFSVFATSFLLKPHTLPLTMGLF